MHKNAWGKIDGRELRARAQGPAMFEVCMEEKN